MSLKILLPLCALILFSLGCAGSNLSDNSSAQVRFEAGMKNLENGKYLKAQSDFQYAVMRGAGTDVGDDAQYYLGESYFLNKEYILAIAEYEKLTRRMSYSPFVEKARFQICEAYRIESPKYYHDQEYTEKALERYQEFLEDFPNTTLKGDVLVSIEKLREKLGVKLYETGILYIKLEEYDSAIITFQDVIDKYYDTKIIDDARQGMIIALAKNKDLDSAELMLNKHKETLTNNGLFEDAKIKIDKIKKKLEKVEN
mgnify:FL=1